MESFGEGDRVRIDIPDESDPDHHLHGNHGTIVAVIEDEAGLHRGTEIDSDLYRIQLEPGTTVDVRRRDLRRPLD